MKLDILAIGVHPDDVELGCSGTIINEIKNGIIAHKLNNKNDTINPVEVPKKSLKIAPV